MKNIIIIITLSYMAFGYGQTPDWNVDENNYEYSMSLVAFVNIDGTNLNSTNDRVGAFVNGELRGETNLVYVSSNDRYYAYLTVFANENNEEVAFKVYNSTTNQIIDLPQVINFEINAHFGDVFQAFSLANPVLSNQAEILNFGFDNASITSSVINDAEVVINIESPVDLTELNANFELSQGARLFNETTLVESSNNLFDYSSPVVLQVMSQDESVLKEWTITVNLNSSVGNLVYYKKDAVCYRGGEIKVTSTIDGVTAILRNGSTIIDTQTFNSGEVLFRGLETGTYVAFINGIEKEIIINLNE